MNVMLQVGEGEKRASLECWVQREVDLNSRWRTLPSGRAVVVSFRQPNETPHYLLWVWTFKETFVMMYSSQLNVKQSRMLCRCRIQTYSIFKICWTQSLFIHSPISEKHYHLFRLVFSLLFKLFSLYFSSLTIPKGNYPTLLLLTCSTMSTS